VNIFDTIRSWEQMAAELSRRATRLRKRGQFQDASFAYAQAVAFHGCAEQMRAVLKGKAA
jgi:hypothetical protein